MLDHNASSKEAAIAQLKEYFKPSSYKVTYRLKNLNEIRNLDKDLFYDLIILNSDCTITGYKAKERAKEFEETLKVIGPQSELVVNPSTKSKKKPFPKSYYEFRQMGDIFSDIIPVSMLVRYSDRKGIRQYPQLLRVDKGNLSSFCILKNNAVDVTEQNVYQNSYKSKNHPFAGMPINSIYDTFKKPDPRVIDAVIKVNKHVERVAKNPCILIVGDKYLIDIVAGNLAGINTVKVAPYKPLTEPLGSIIQRYLFDFPIGSILSRL